MAMMTIVILIVSLAVMIGARVFIMLAVGNDAKTLEIKNRALWMVLCFLVPWAAIVYACIRKKLEKNAPKYCYDCKSVIEPNAVFCPKCSSSNVVDMVKSDAPRRNRTTKLFAVIGAVLMAMSVASCCIMSFMAVLNSAINLVDEFSNYGNYNYNFFDDEDDYYNYYNFDEYFENQPYDDFFN